jgi:phage tail sheath protein FI
MAEVILSPGVFQIESDQSLYTQGPQVIGAAIVGPTVGGRPMVPTYVTTYNQYLSLYGDVFKSGSYYYEYFTSMAAREYFSNGGQTLLVTRIISGSAYNTYATSDVTAIDSTVSFELETLAWGDQMNSTSSEVSGALASGSAYNVRWEVTNVQTGSNGGTFTIVVRRGDDNTAQKNILETWANVSLDPQLPNYVSRIIGDLKPKYNATTNQVEFEGSYANQSQYIRVASVNTPNADSIDNNGNYKNTQYSGSLPALGSGSFGGGVADTSQAKLMNENITTSNIQGFDPADYVEAFQLLTNSDEYQFNMLLAPGAGLDTAAADDMISTVENRGDSIAIVDNGIYTNATVTGAAQKAAASNSNYAATYFPWVQLYSSNLGKTVWCPPSTVIGGVLAFNDQVGAEWFAPAGLNRGGIPSVVRAQFRLSQTDRDTLYTANVNPLATFPGTGVCVWGQKTLQRKPTALDRVNVRRLLIALKGYIGQVARTLVFEQNTTVTRNRFLSQVNPYLSSVVQRQGLFAYKVVMDDTNNTPDVVDRNQLVGQIYIQPTKTAEFIILNFNVLPTGATFPA